MHNKAYITLLTCPKGPSVSAMLTGTGPLVTSWCLPVDLLAGLPAPWRAPTGPQHKHRRGPFYWWFLTHNLMETLLAKLQWSDHYKFCTCHDSCAVMACTKFCSDHLFGIGQKVQQNFYWILDKMECFSVNRPLGPILPTEHGTDALAFYSVAAQLWKLCCHKLKGPQRHPVIFMRQGFGGRFILLSSSNKFLWHSISMDENIQYLTCGTFCTLCHKWWLCIKRAESSLILTQNIISMTS